MADLIVVKVGGSLFDLPELGPGLRRWSKNIHRIGFCSFRRRSGGERRSRISSHSPDARRILALAGNPHDGRERRRAPISAGRFRRHAKHPRILPKGRGKSAQPTPQLASNERRHCRQSGGVFKARELVVLKSVELPEGLNWTEAAEKGLVDWTFGEVVERSGLAVRWVNFRKWMIAD